LPILTNPEKIQAFRDEWKKTANQEIDDVTANEKRRWAYNTALKHLRDTKSDLRTGLSTLEENNPNLVQLLKSTGLVDELEKTRAADMNLYTIRKRRGTKSAEQKTQGETTAITAPPVVPVDLPKSIPIDGLLKATLEYQNKYDKQAPVNKDAIRAIKLDDDLSKISGVKHELDDEDYKSIAAGNDPLGVNTVRQVHIGKALEQEETIKKATANLDTGYRNAKESIAKGYLNGQTLSPKQQADAQQKLDSWYQQESKNLLNQGLKFQDREYQRNKNIVLAQQDLASINFATNTGTNLVIGDTEKARQQFEQSTLKHTLSFIKDAQTRGLLGDVDANEIVNRVTQGSSPWDHLKDLFTDTDTEKFADLYGDFVNQAENKKKAIDITNAVKLNRGAVIPLAELGWEMNADGGIGVIRDVKSAAKRGVGKILGEGTPRKYIQGLLDIGLEGFSNSPGWTDRVKRYFTGEDIVDYGSDELVSVLSSDFREQGTKGKNIEAASLLGTDSFVKSLTMTGTELASELALGRLGVGGRMASATQRPRAAWQSLYNGSKNATVQKIGSVLERKLPDTWAFAKANNYADDIAVRMATEGTDIASKRTSGLKNIAAAMQNSDSGKAYFNMLKAVAPQNMEAERIANMALTFGYADVLRQVGEGYDAESALKSVATGAMFGGVNELAMRYFDKIASNIAKLHNTANINLGLQPIGWNVEYFAKLSTAARALSNPFGNVAQSFTQAVFEGNDYSLKNAAQDLVLGSFFGIRDVQSFKGDRHGKMYREESQRLINRIKAGETNPLEGTNEFAGIAEDVVSMAAKDKVSVPIEKKIEETTQEDEGVIFDLPFDLEGTKQLLTKQEQQTVQVPNDMSFGRLLKERTGKDEYTLNDLVGIADLNEQGKSALRKMAEQPALQDVKVQVGKFDDDRMLAYSPSQKTIYINDSYTGNADLLSTQLTKRIGEEIAHAYDLSLLNSDTRQGKLRQKELTALQTNFIEQLNSQAFDLSRSGDYYQSYLKRNNVEDNDYAHQAFLDEVEYYTGKQGTEDLAEFSGAMFNSASGTYDMIRDAANSANTSIYNTLKKSVTALAGRKLQDKTILDEGIEAVMSYKVPDVVPEVVNTEDAQGTASFVLRNLLDRNPTKQDIGTEELTKIAKINSIANLHSKPQEYTQDLYERVKLADNWEGMSESQKVDTAYNLAVNDVLGQREEKLSRRAFIENEEVRDFINRDIDADVEPPTYITVARAYKTDSDIRRSLNEGDFDTYLSKTLEYTKNDASLRGYAFDPDVTAIEARRLWRRNHDNIPVKVLTIKGDNIESTEKEIRRLKSFERVLGQHIQPSKYMAYATNELSSTGKLDTPVDALARSGTFNNPIVIEPLLDNDGNKVLDADEIFRKQIELFTDKNLYVIPKGETGMVAFDMTPYTYRVNELINSGDKGKHKEAAKRLVQQLNWHLWKALDADQNWNIGTKPTNIEGLSSYFDMTDLVNRAYKLKEGAEYKVKDPSEVLYNHLKVPKGKDLGIRKAIDEHKDKEDVVNRLNALIEKISKEIITEPDGTTLELFHRSPMLRDNDLTLDETRKMLLEQSFNNAALTLHWAVDPTGSQMFQNPDTKKPIKFGDKYWGVVSQLKAYNTWKTANDVIATAGETYKNWVEDDWNKAGVTIDADGNMNQKWLVIDADVVKEMPELNYVAEVLSKDNADGASFYTNALTRKLESDMLQYPVEASSIKPAYVNSKNGNNVTIKTMTHGNFLLNDPKDPNSRQLFGFAEQLKLQGISRIVLNSGTKMKGSFRYQNDGTFVTDNTKTLVGIVSGDKIDTSQAKELYRQHVAETLLSGIVQPYMIETVPMTGEQGYSLLQGTQPTETSNRSFGALELIHRLDPLYSQALKPIGTLVQNNLNTLQKVKGLRDAFRTGNTDLADKGELKRYFERLAKSIQKNQENPDANVRIFENSNVLQDMISVFDADGNIDRSRFQAFTSVYFDGYLDFFLEQRFKNELEELGKLPIKAKTMTVMPMSATTDDLLRMKSMDQENIVSYYSEIAQDPKRRESLRSIYLNKFGEVPNESMTHEDIANAIIEDNLTDSEAYNTTREVLYMDERGLMKNTEALPDGTTQGVVIGREDYREIMKHLSKSYKGRFTGLQGFKTFYVQSPKDSPESYMPVEIVGVGDFDTGMMLHGDVMTGFTGTDFDGDARALALPTSDWGTDNNDSMNNFLRLHDNLRELGIQKGQYKKDEQQVMKSSADVKGAFNANFKLADGTYPKYEKLKNNPLNLAYHRAAIDANSGMGQGVSLIDRAVSFLLRKNPLLQKQGYVDVGDMRIKPSETIIRNFQILKQLGVVDKNTPTTLNYDDLFYGSMIESYKGRRWSDLSNAERSELKDEFSKKMGLVDKSDVPVYRTLVSEVKRDKDANNKALGVRKDSQKALKSKYDNYLSSQEKAFSTRKYNELTTTKTLDNLVNVATERQDLRKMRPASKIQDMSQANYVSEMTFLKEFLPKTKPMIIRDTPVGQFSVSMKDNEKVLRFMPKQGGELTLSLTDIIGDTGTPTEKYTQFLNQVPLDYFSLVEIPLKDSYDTKGKSAMIMEAFFYPQNVLSISHNDREKLVGKMLANAAKVGESKKTSADELAGMYLNKIYLGTYSVNMSIPGIVDAMRTQGVNPLTSDGTTFIEKLFELASPQEESISLPEDTQGTFFGLSKMRKSLSPERIFSEAEGKLGRAIDWNDPKEIENVINSSQDYIRKTLSTNIDDEALNTVMRLFDPTRTSVFEEMGLLKDGTERQKVLAAYLLQAQKTAQIIDNREKRLGSSAKKWFQDARLKNMFITRDVDEVINKASANSVAVTANDDVGKRTIVSFKDGVPVTQTLPITLSEHVNRGMDMQYLNAGMSKYYRDFVLPHRTLHENANLIDSMIENGTTLVSAYDNEDTQRALKYIGSLVRNNEQVPMPTFSITRNGFDGVTSPDFYVNVGTDSGTFPLSFSSKNFIKEVDAIVENMDFSMFSPDVLDEVKQAYGMVITAKVQDMGIGLVKHSIAESLGSWFNEKGYREGKPKRMDVANHVEQTLSLMRGEAEKAYNTTFAGTLKNLAEARGTGGQANQAGIALVISDYLRNNTNPENYYKIGEKLYGFEPMEQLYSGDLEGETKVQQMAGKVQRQMQKIVDNYTSQDVVSQQYFESGKQVAEMKDLPNDIDLSDLMYAMGHGEDFVSYGADIWKKNHLQGHEKMQVGLDNSFLSLYLTEPDKDELAHDNIAMSLQSAQRRGSMISRREKLGDIRREAKATFDSGEMYHIPEQTGMLTNLQYYGTDGEIKHKQGLMLGIVNRPIVKGKETLGHEPTVVMLDPDRESMSLVSLNNVGTFETGRYTNTLRGVEETRQDNLKGYMKANTENLLSFVVDNPLRLSMQDDGTWNKRYDRIVQEVPEEVLKANRGGLLQRNMNFGWNTALFMGRAGYIGLTSLPKVAIAGATISSGGVAPLAGAMTDFVMKPARNSFSNILSSARMMVNRNGLTSVFKIGLDQTGVEKGAQFISNAQNQRLKSTNNPDETLGRTTMGLSEYVESNKEKATISAPFRNWWNNTIANTKSLPSVYKKLKDDPNLAAIREEAFNQIMSSEGLQEKISEVEGTLEGLYKEQNISKERIADYNRALSEIGTYTIPASEESLATLDYENEPDINKKAQILTDKIATEEYRMQNRAKEIKQLKRTKYRHESTDDIVDISDYVKGNLGTIIKEKGYTAYMVKHDKGERLEMYDKNGRSVNEVEAQRIKLVEALSYYTQLAGFQLKTEHKGIELATRNAARILNSENPNLFNKVGNTVLAQNAINAMVDITNGNYVRSVAENNPMGAASTLFSHYQRQMAFYSLYDMPQKISAYNSLLDVLGQDKQGFAKVKRWFKDYDINIDELKVPNPMLQFTKGTLLGLAQLATRSTVAYLAGYAAIELLEDDEVTKEVFQSVSSKKRDVDMAYQINGINNMQYKFMSGLMSASIMSANLLDAVELEDMAKTTTQQMALLKETDRGLSEGTRLMSGGLLQSQIIDALPLMTMQLYNIATDSEQSRKFEEKADDYFIGRWINQAGAVAPFTGALAPAVYGTQMTAKELHKQKGKK